jgi:hypothetical protein
LDTGRPAAEGGADDDGRRAAAKHDRSVLLGAGAGRQHLVARIGRRGRGALLEEEMRVSVLGLDVDGAMQMVVDAVKINQVIDFLEKSVEDIKAKQVEPIAPGSFGNLPTATELGHHTTLARDTVIEAIQDVIAGLKVYAENVDSYRKDVFVTDEEVSTVNVAPLQVATDCITGTMAAQNSASASQCVAPGGSEG